MLVSDDGLLLGEKSVPEAKIGHGYPAILGSNKIQGIIRKITQLLSDFVLLPHAGGGPADRRLADVKDSSNNRRGYKKPVQEIGGERPSAAQC
ncbi:hypothetical protein HNR47_000870 [Methylopila jiangsuensis]|uniref:hypothetical protein n=1 Tax=Methylopila jiangsuensis TaxID=586230 RepID=UPI0022F3188E|nr:hypothetical protein [Methylopila jiangsuensis]MDR6284887.1 hypothetical protein [Methylopila jiangsuensis]